MKLSFANLHRSAALIAGLIAITVTLTAEEIPLPKAVISAPQVYSYADLAGQKISIKRDDRIGDDDYIVQNLTGRTLVQLKIMFRNKEKGTHPYLAAFDTFTFHGIPDEWGDKDEDYVKMQYCVETKSLTEAYAEITKRATNDFPLPKGTNVSSDARTAMLQAVRHAAEEEPKWSLATGIFFHSHKWRDFLKKIE